LLNEAGRTSIAPASAAEVGSAMVTADAFSIPLVTLLGVTAALGALAAERRDETRGAARGAPRRAPAMGPLRRHPTNPRYFTDGSGEVIYLTGSHRWETSRTVTTPK
jgi:hypothetical protein